VSNAGGLISKELANGSKLDIRCIVAGSCVVDTVVPGSFEVWSRDSEESVMGVLYCIIQISLFTPFSKPGNNPSDVNAKKDAPSY
jgi:hypothetical protein